MILKAYGILGFLVGMIILSYRFYKLYSNQKELTNKYNIKIIDLENYSKKATDEAFLLEYNSIKKYSNKTKSIGIVYSLIYISGFVLLTYL